MVFKKHFELASEFNLPLYLVSRNAEKDFVGALKANFSKFAAGGVVHCFTGTTNELKEVLALGLYVGVTGLSFRTEENLQIVKKIPLNKLVISTDCPFCPIKRSFAGSRYIKTYFQLSPKEHYRTDHMVAGRNEPCAAV